MTKKTRSPAKQPSSPNPRPKQRNRQTSVDRFFALKSSSRAKINEAMSGNTADSPIASDNESTNPYDVLRDDDDEVTTDIDQKESDEDEDAISSQNSARLSPSESDYESAHDTMSLAGHTMNLQRKMVFSDDGSQTNQGKLHPLAIAATRAENQETIASPSPNAFKSSDVMETTSFGDHEPLDSKPPARDNDLVSSPSDTQNEPNAEELSSSPNSSRNLCDNRKAAPTTHVDDIEPSVLDDLLYEASQHDSALISTSGGSTISHLATQVNPVPNLNSKPSTQAKSRPGPSPFPAAGRGRGGPSRPGTTTQSLPASHASTKHPVQEISQTTGDSDTPMPDAQESPVQREPDFSFSRPIYSNLRPPSPARKHFFRCTWRVDIPKNTAPEEGVRDAILEIWSALKDADRRLIIYPWHQSAHG
jgi:hypothetical protein